jgi:hypothetical protein
VVEEAEVPGENHRHDIVEIFLKVALNTITLTQLSSIVVIILNENK